MRSRAPALLLAALLLLPGCMRTIRLTADLVSLNGQTAAQRDADLQSCMDLAARWAKGITDEAAGRALGNALGAALAGAATGAAVGAAVGHGLAGYGAKYGVASWGTQAAMGGVLTQPDWYALTQQATGECLTARGYAVQSLVRVAQ